MNRKNILIVDDEQDVLLVLEKGLTAEGYSIITVYNGNNDLSIAISQYPGLVIEER